MIKSSEFEELGWKPTEIDGLDFAHPDRKRPALLHSVGKIIMDLEPSLPMDWHGYRVVCLAQGVVGKHDTPPTPEAFSNGVLELFSDMVERGDVRRVSPMKADLPNYYAVEADMPTPEALREWHTRLLESDGFDADQLVSTHIGFVSCSFAATAMTVGTIPASSIESGELTFAQLTREANFI